MSVQFATTDNTTTPTTTHTVLRAQGFSCPSCVNKIETMLKRTHGVSDAKVHFSSQRVEVDHDPTEVSVADLVIAIGQAGYIATPAA